MMGYTGGLIGTGTLCHSVSLGCIAVACGDTADDLYDMPNDYLGNNDSIEVTVGYELY